MRNVYLGIDTSNYTTSTAVLHERDKSVVQQKKLLPVKQGELDYGKVTPSSIIHNKFRIYWMRYGVMTMYQKQWEFL